VHITFNIDIPIPVEHLLMTGPNSAGVQCKKKLLTGASALCWTLWISRNDIIFDKSPIKTYIHVLYQGTQ
jgi:hypothetical protein